MFCFDTSAFMDGWIRYYPPDVFASLWKNLEKLIEAKDLIASIEVLHEMEKKDDALASWAKQNRGMFQPIDEQQMLETKKILAAFPRLIDTRKGRSAVDPFVIALAKTRGAVVITGEQGGTAEKPKIPFVCDAVGVRCIGLTEFIRSQKWVF